LKENEFKNRLAEANKGNASLSNYAADKSLFYFFYYFFSSLSSIDSSLSNSSILLYCFSRWPTSRYKFFKNSELL